MMESGLFGGIASRMYNLKSVKKMLNECVFDHTVINEHDAAEYFKPVADSSSRYAVRRTLAEFDENALISSLREIQAPVLLLWGEDDKWHPAGEVDEYRSSCAAARAPSFAMQGTLFMRKNPTGSPNLSAASFRRDTIINIVLQKTGSKLGFRNHFKKRLGANRLRAAAVSEREFRMMFPNFRYELNMN